VDSAPSTRATGAFEVPERLDRGGRDPGPVETELREQIGDLAVGEVRERRAEDDDARATVVPSPRQGARDQRPDAAFGDAVLHGDDERGAGRGGEHALVERYRSHVPDR